MSDDGIEPVLHGGLAVDRFGKGTGVRPCATAHLFARIISRVRAIAAYDVDWSTAFELSLTIYALYKR